MPLPVRGHSWSVVASPELDLHNGVTIQTCGSAKVITTF